MGILNKISRIVRAKLSSIINEAEDPVEQLDYAYEKLRDQKQTVKSSIADVQTQKKKLEIKVQRLEEDIESHNKRARLATKKEREGLARRALEKKKSKMAQVEELNQQIQEIEGSLENLKEKNSKLESKLSDLKTKKEVQKARFQAAKTKKNVAEATTGVGDTVSVDEAIEDIEEEIKQKEARAEAVEELSEEDSETIDEELDNVVADAQVDKELESLRKEVDIGEESEGEELEAGKNPTD